MRTCGVKTCVQRSVLYLLFFFPARGVAEERDERGWERGRSVYDTQVFMVKIMLLVS